MLMYGMFCYHKGERLGLLQAHVTVYCTTARREKEEERIKALKENTTSKAIISFQAYYQLNQLELLEALPLKIHQDGAVQSH